VFIVIDFFIGEARLLDLPDFLAVLLNLLMVAFFGEPPPATGVSNSVVFPVTLVGDFVVWLKAEVLIIY
jgi:hypothetical protein